MTLAARRRIEPAKGIGTGAAPNAVAVGASRSGKGSLASAASGAAGSAGTACSAGLLVTAEDEFSIKSPSRITITSPPVGGGGTCPGGGPVAGGGGIGCPDDTRTSHLLPTKAIASSGRRNRGGASSRHYNRSTQFCGSADERQREKSIYRFLLKASRVASSVQVDRTRAQGYESTCLPGSRRHDRPA